MTTAVVVTTIVTDPAGEVNVAEQLLDQIRQNTHVLHTQLTQQNLEAQVTSAVFDVADFVHCVNEWLRRRGEVELPALPAAPVKPAQPEEMSEAEFMDYVLNQIDQGNGPGYARFTAAELAAAEDEPIGQHFSQQPFLY
jgi:hypothetical protein